MATQIVITSIIKQAMGICVKYQLKVQSNNWVDYGLYAYNLFEIRNTIEESLTEIRDYDGDDSVQVSDTVDLQPNNYYYVYVAPFKIRHINYSFTVVDLSGTGSKPILGDADDDGDVTILDATAIQR